VLRILISNLVFPVSLISDPRPLISDLRSLSFPPSSVVHLPSSFHPLSFPDLCPPISGVIIPQFLNPSIPKSLYISGMEFLLHLFHRGGLYSIGIKTFSIFCFPGGLSFFPLFCAFFMIHNLMYFLATKGGVKYARKFTTQKS